MSMIKFFKYFYKCMQKCMQTHTKNQTSEFIHIFCIACCVFLEGSCITFAIKKSTFFIYHYFLKLKAQVYSVYLERARKCGFKFFGPLLHWLQNPWSQAVSKCCCLRLWFWFWGKYRTRAARSQHPWSILRSPIVSPSPLLPVPSPVSSFQYILCQGCL